MASGNGSGLPNDLTAVDRVEVSVLIDNVTDILSTVPENVTPEVPNVMAAGATELSGECLCCAHWGLSLVITAWSGDTRHSLLFDSGPEGTTVDRNGNRLGQDFGAIESVVLSHGHWDHSGGMLTALDLITTANGGKKVPFHTNPGMFVKRALRLPDGGVVPFKDVSSVNELTEAGADVVNSEDPQLLLDGMYYLSGEIPRRTSYEVGLPGHVKRNADDTDWDPDPLLMDERWVAVNVAGKGLIVFTACSHAGVVNVLNHARDVFDPVPIYGVMGGFHLSGAANEKIIPETVEDMKAFDLKMIVPGHCTGWRAIHALVNAFGEEIVVPSAVGRRHRFEADTRP
ncbi:MAG: MBL fold metallo-hydrolase [Rhodospirillales bacterium]|nr:MBL fold metallo-hydrolase [Rhodospirillales bacterium]